MIDDDGEMTSAVERHLIAFGPVLLLQYLMNHHHHHASHHYHGAGAHVGIPAGSTSLSARDSAMPPPSSVQPLGLSHHRSSRGSDTSSAYSGSDTMHSSVPSSEQVSSAPAAVPRSSSAFNSIASLVHVKFNAAPTFRSPPPRRGAGSKFIVSSERLEKAPSDFLGRPMDVRRMLTRSLARAGRGGMRGGRGRRSRPRRRRGRPDRPHGVHRRLGRGRGPCREHRCKFLFIIATLLRLSWLL